MQNKEVGFRKRIAGETINRRIFEIRGQKVMLDHDLASLYGVGKKILNRSVKRNITRFPDDFMFQMTKIEFENLRFQFGTSSDKGYGGRRYLPYVFTEQGVAMLSGVLNSERAIEVNIVIMRAFVNMRNMISENSEIKQKLTEIERHQADWVYPPKRG